MHPNDLAPLTERDIAEYLMQNQGFFQRNPELLTDLHLGSAHGQRHGAALRARHGGLDEGQSNLQSVGKGVHGRIVGWDQKGLATLRFI